MSDDGIFTAAERRYLESQRLARIATTGKDGSPHVTPVGFSFNPGLGTIDIGGRNLIESKKFRDIQRSGRAAVVIDDNPSVDPWKVRGIEVRGEAEAMVTPDPLIRIHPGRIISWGIESESLADRHARTITSTKPSGRKSQSL